MAQVPYAHVLAPSRIYIEGALAFNTGDSIPLDTADRLGLLDPPYSLEQLPAYSNSGDDDVVFLTGELHSIVEEAVAIAIAEAGVGTTINGGTP